MTFYVYFDVYPKLLYDILEESATALHKFIF